MRSPLTLLALLSTTACFTPVTGGESVDADNDGISAVADCDDSDPNSTAIADDADCDGIITADDCSDDDPTSASTAEDADCDGVLTADDCDDNDASSTSTSTDADCDGIVTASDCDDTDATSTTIAADADCDGIVTADDCDDNDASSLSTAEDEDCDGAKTADDCDDTDPGSTVVANDADCDGIVTANDCDDTDPSDATDTDDADCDGISTADDCDDNDPNSTTVADDADCDGIVTADDCDDTNPTSTAIPNDADCDGTVTPDDCDDTDADSTIISEDADCDTVLSGDDCDDTNSALLYASGDPDCDGVQSVASMNVNNQQSDVDIDVQLQVVFADPVDDATLAGLRVGVSGVLDGKPKTLWQSPMAGTIRLQTDGRTVIWTPNRGRLQEFETLHWIEIEDVANTNGQTMSQVRRTFTTVMVDPDYAYRLQNGQFDGALANWEQPDGSVFAGLLEPFTNNVSGTRWMFDQNNGWWLMTNRWLGPNRLLEGHDGTGPAFMAIEGEAVYTGRQWAIVPAIENASATAGTSPHYYWLETNWQGSDRTLGYHSTGPNSELYVGMKDKAGGVYADHIWILHNVGKP